MPTKGNSIHKYDVVLSLVEEGDANFILSLRSSVRNKYISPTEPDLEKQIKWIKEYKEREIAGKEYYFIVSDAQGNKWGTTRIYNFDKNKFETGSWVFMPDSPAGIAIKGDIIGREFAFDQLGFETCTFAVRKENRTVLRYHDQFKPWLVGEDELNLYFELSKEHFYLYSKKLLKFL